MIAGAVSIGAFASIPASAETTVSRGGDALQTAIDAASDGDTPVITDLTAYDLVTIGVGVGIEALVGPTMEGDGGTGVP